MEAQKMRAMNQGQYEVVAFFLKEFKIAPKVLIKKWKKFGVELERHEVYRVMLTNSYEVYKNDDMPDEDVILAVEGAGESLFSIFGEKNT